MLDAALAGKLPPQWRAFALAESGQIALAQRDATRAIQQLQEAIRLNPDDQQTHFALGTALANGGQHAQAQVHLDRSAEMLKRHNQIHELTKELSQNPASADLQFEVGRTLLELGLKHEALRWMLLAAAGDRPPPATHSALANLYADLGNQALAQHHRTLAARRAAAQSSTPSSDNP